MKLNFMNRKDLFLYLSLGIFTYTLTFVATMADSDFWARLAVGSIFFNTGSLLKRDIFAYTPIKDMWIDHEWGAGTVFYTVAHYFGDFGLYILKFLLIFMIFLFLAKIIKLNNEKVAGINIPMLFLLSFSIFPSVITNIRSQLFTYCFFVIWIYLLERVKRDEGRLIWLFPATMLLWVNLHGGFVTGLGLLVVYAVGEALNKRNPVKYLKILAFTLPVTLINPYGIRFWEYMAEAVSMRRPHIFEWQHFTPAGPIITLFGIKTHLFFGFEIFTVLTLIVAIKLLINKVPKNWTKILLIIITLYLGVAHQRHIVLFILTIFGFLYSQYIDLFKQTCSMLSDKVQNILAKSGNITAIALAIIFIITSHIFSTKIYAIPSFYPVGAIEFIKQNNLSGNLSIPYRWGSYALWKLYPECLVSVDGRYEEVYPDYVFDMAADFSGDLDKSWNLYKNTQTNSKNWENFINKFSTDIIILPISPLNQIKIEKLKNWKVVYSDMISYVLLPKNKANKLFVSPDFLNPVYWHENLSKEINIKKTNILRDRNN